MATATERNLICVALARVFTSPAIEVKAAEVSSWLFGGGAGEPKTFQYLDAALNFLGYSNAQDSDYDRAGFIAVMTPLIGTELATLAADEIENDD